MQVEVYAAMDTGNALTPMRYNATLDAHDCLIKVLACGICHSDIHMIDNDWGSATYPLIPGHEVIGEVVEKGSQVHHLKVGDRVGVGWQRSACLECRDCLHGNENLCPESEPLIIGNHGGFASHLVADSRFSFPLPEGIETELGGPLLCGGITVYSGLLHAGMRGGQEIGVIGVGGLGHMAVQFAHKLGNRVTVFTTSDDKAEFAHRLGADDAIVVPKGERPPKPKTHLNILLSTVPTSLDWSSYLNYLDTDGVLSLVGLPDEPLEIPAFKLMMRRRRIMSSPIGGRGEMLDMLRACDQFGIRPIVETFPMAQINDALQRVRDNTVRYRAVVTAS